MLKNSISEKIFAEIKHEPTPNQSKIIEKLSAFVASRVEDEIFVMKGYAGTGKTTIIGALVNSLKYFNYKTFLLAPTGRAAKVLSSYAEKKAYTIHKKIYRQKSATDDFGVFQLDQNLHTNTIFIVDEASMISNQNSEITVFGTGNLLDDLIEYVYNGHNCKLILCGDVAQLPPVGLAISPALEKESLQKYSNNVTDFTLTNVVRQKEQSGILFNATSIRNLISDTEYKQGYPKIKIKPYTDILKINGQTLIEEINEAYNKHGIKETMVVCRSNKRANKYNAGIRNAVLFREEEISVGDVLMIVKNNYFWLDDNQDTDFIANGDIIEIRRIHKFEEKYGFRFATITANLVDYNNFEIEVKIILDTLWVDAPALSQDDNRKLYYTIAEEYSDLTTKKAKYKKIKENPYFNALQVKFSYAVTCHKSQGGQWKTIFVDQGYIGEDTPDIEYLRWLYTAVTRATDKVFLVNFKNDFFYDEDICDDYF